MHGTLVGKDRLLELPEGHHIEMARVPQLQLHLQSAADCLETRLPQSSQNSSFLDLSTDNTFASTLIQHNGHAPCKMRDASLLLDMLVK